MKIKMEKSSRYPKIRHDINTPLILFEPHIGEGTWVEDIYLQLMDYQKKTNAKIIPSGDLLNADDLRDRGLLSQENVFDQMAEFDIRLSAVKDNVIAILQMNHGTRMYGKQLPRQFGESIVIKWEKILSKFKNAKILPPEESCLELELTDNGKKVAVGLLFHPQGLSSANAFINRLNQNYAGYDFYIVFHFHTSQFKQLIKQRPNGLFEEGKIFFIPPFIENPMYSHGKFPPIDAGFVIIHKTKDVLGNQIIRLETIRKSGLSGKTYVC